MRVRLVRRPGQHGTRAYLEQYGDRLVCVRYRYDEAARRRYKTIEIIVDEAPWEPRSQRVALEHATPSKAVASVVAQPAKLQLPEPAVAPAFKPGTYVGVKVSPTEFKLAQKLRSAGALWLSNFQLWQITYAEAVALGLSSRIIGSIGQIVAAKARAEGRH